MLGLSLLFAFVSVHVGKLGVFLLKRLLVNLKSCSDNQQPNHPRARDSCTLDFVFEISKLRIRFMDDRIKLAAEFAVLVGKVLAHCFVVQSANGQSFGLTRTSRKDTFLAWFDMPKRQGPVQHIP